MLFRSGNVRSTMYVVSGVSRTVVAYSVNNISTSRRAANFNVRYRGNKLMAVMLKKRGGLLVHGGQLAPQRGAVLQLVHATAVKFCVGGVDEGAIPLGVDE